MNQSTEYKVSSKENLYLSIKIMLSVVLYPCLGFLFYWATTTDQAQVIIPLLIYLLIFLLFIFFQLGVKIGYLKGNAIKVSQNQFPEIYAIAKKQSESLGLRRIPDIYILQNGGIINAFATQFFGTNYIVLFSEVVEAGLKDDKAMLEFIMGHEMGHIKRKHLLKKIMLFPSMIVPFLGQAYSRACEYTCDSIGHSLCPHGAQNGLILLASGRNLCSSVNKNEFLNQIENEAGFWNWFSEKISSHPHLSKRVEQFKETKIISTPSKPLWQVQETTNILKTETTASDDYSKYMPK